jgi:hypothetical protein
LALGLEPPEHGLGVHAGLVDLERHLTRERARLLGSLSSACGPGTILPLRPGPNSSALFPPILA